MSLKSNSFDKNEVQLLVLQKVPVVSWFCGKKCSSNPYRDKIICYWEIYLNIDKLLLFCKSALMLLEIVWNSLKVKAKSVTITSSGKLYSIIFWNNTDHNTILHADIFQPFHLISNIPFGRLWHIFSQSTEFDSKAVDIKLHLVEHRYKPKTLESSILKGKSMDRINRLCKKARTATKFKYLFYHHLQQQFVIYSNCFG